MFYCGYTLDTSVLCARSFAVVLGLIYTYCTTSCLSRDKYVSPSWAVRFFLQINALPFAFGNCSQERSRSVEVYIFLSEVLANLFLIFPLCEKNRHWVKQFWKYISRHTSNLLIWYQLVYQKFLMSWHHFCNFWSISKALGYCHRPSGNWKLNWKYTFFFKMST